MNEQPEQLMSHSREVSMTATEKAAMRHMLIAYTLSHRPYTPSAFAVGSWVRRHAIISSAILAVLVLGGTGVSASVSGPNDALYNFRLNVNDRIESAMALNEDSQLDVELRQIDRQLNDEDGARDEALADDESSDSSDTEQPEQLNLNIETKSQDDTDNNITDDGLDAEIRQADKELRQEEKATIKLDN